MKKIRLYDFNEMKTVSESFDTLVELWAKQLKDDYSDLDEFFTVHFISKKHRKAFENSLKRFGVQSWHTIYT